MIDRWGNIITCVWGRKGLLALFWNHLTWAFHGSNFHKQYCWLPNPWGGMPEHALPQGYRKGRLSYTISSPTSKARVEVLLKQRAFRIVKIGEKDGYWDHWLLWLCFNSFAMNIVYPNDGCRSIYSKSREVLKDNSIQHFWKQDFQGAGWREWWFCF